MNRKLNGEDCGQFCFFLPGGNVFLFIAVFLGRKITVSWSFESRWLFIVFYIYFVYRSYIYVDLLKKREKRDNFLSEDVKKKGCSLGPQF